MPTTALAPCSLACRKRSSKASSRVLSHRFVSSVILPPQIVCSAAPRFPIRLRERTTIPRTIPKFLTIRYPGKSIPEVTIPTSTLGIGFSLKKWHGSRNRHSQPLTGAILAALSALRERSSSAILSAESGNTLLLTGNHRDSARRLSRLASDAVACLCAPAARLGSRILRAARGGALPMQGY